MGAVSSSKALVSIYVKSSIMGNANNSETILHFPTFDNVSTTRSSCDVLFHEVRQGKAKEHFLREERTTGERTIKVNKDD
jgi:hypothetical protein